MINRPLPAILVILFFCVGGSAQSVRPTPPPNDDVVKISTTLIQVDATVTDKKGKVITGLTKDDFEIYENGQKQAITSFSFVSNARITAVPPAEKESKNAVPIPPTAVRPEQVRRTMALVVDDLMLSSESSYYVRRALKKFVDEQMQDGDLVAILRTGSGVGALQQFTTDKRLLYAAIEKVKWNPGGFAGMTALAPIEAKAPKSDIEMDNGGAGERTLEGQEKEFNALRESTFTFGTLAVIDHIIKGMQGLPGRKSIMLLSEGFALRTKDAVGFEEDSRFLQKLRGLVDRANRSSVVVYTMDPRGLQYTGATAMDNTGGRSVLEVQQAASERADKMYDTQDGLRFLAKETGGFAFINNNDLSGGIRQVLDDQSYYLIGYEPDDDTFDPVKWRFNKLEVRVKRTDASVRFRSGFFGVGDAKTAAAKPAETGPERIAEALSSPFAANGITLYMNSLFGNNPGEGSFIRSLLLIDAHDLKFTDAPDGGKKVTFDIAAVCFGDNGVPVAQIGRQHTVTLTKDNYEYALKEGLLYDLTIKTPKPGAYQLRIALSDVDSKLTGSASQFVEVPDLKKNRLTLSGMLLENTPFDLWTKRNMGTAPVQDTIASDPLGDTSQRKFKRGTALDYGFAIFNAKLDAAKRADLSMQVRVFRDGKLSFEGESRPVPTDKQTDMERVKVAGSLKLENTLQLGDYVLQIVVTDNLAKGRRKVTSQFVQFEVIE